MVLKADFFGSVQVITCAEFHPQHCHHFAYSSSRGGIRLSDLRASALCDRHAKSFEATEPPVSFSPCLLLCLFWQVVCISQKG